MTLVSAGAEKLKWVFHLFIQRDTPGTKQQRRKKTTRTESDSDEDYIPDSDEDDEDEHAVEQPPPPNTASWSSDHNYIAVAPVQTAPISSTTVLDKKCMYLSESLKLLLSQMFFNET